MFGLTLKEKNAKLLKAMAEENVQKIIRAVLSGADVNLQDSVGTTPLIAALSAEKPASFDEIELLLSLGADVNIPNNNGTLPLHWADDAQIAEMLLRCGAPVNHQNKYGDTALHWSHNYGVVNKLLDFGANANIQNKDGLTPIQLNPPANIKIRLIHNGADIHVVNKNGSTPLMEAAALGETDVINAILDRFDNAVYAQNNQGETALMIAAENNQIEATKCLVLRNAEIEAKDKEGRTTLMRAISHNAFEAAEFLLSEKADINAQDNEGNTVLLSLLQQPIDWLLTHHADPHRKNKAGLCAASLLQEMKEKQPVETPQPTAQKIVSRSFNKPTQSITAHERGDG